MGRRCPPSLRSWQSGLRCSAANGCWRVSNVYIVVGDPAVDLHQRLSLCVAITPPQSEGQLFLLPAQFGDVVCSEFTPTVLQLAFELVPSDLEFVCICNHLDAPLFHNSNFAGRRVPLRAGTEGRP
jgi:hypothetical protein